MAQENARTFPDFTGLSHQGGEVDLRQYGPGKNLVVFFFPKARTPG